jgi:hypothetical protein
VRTLGTVQNHDNWYGVALRRIASCMKPSMRKTSLVGCTELWFLVQRFRGASGISKLPVEVSFSGIIIRECVYLDATNEAGNFFGATWRSPILSRKTGWGERHRVCPPLAIQPLASTSKSKR